jgi:hypothetical protein
MEVHQVAEGLHELDEGGLCTRYCGAAGFLEQASGDAAKLTEPSAMARKERPQQPRHGEHVLAVRDRGEDRFLHPLAVEEHPLLVATRAEVPGLAFMQTFA